MGMLKRNLTATALALATTVAFAAAQDYQIVKVASVAGAAIDGLKPKTIFFTDHRIDDTSDKGAFIHFDEWSRTRANEAKFLNLFPTFKEGMVHKVIDGTKKEVKDELQSMSPRRVFCCRARPTPSTSKPSRRCRSSRASIRRSSTRPSSRPMYRP